MAEPDPTKIMTFAKAQDLSKWLKVNHAIERELWAKVFKKYSGIPSVTWNVIVIEALCWGWIDGIKKSIDDQAYFQRITPRKARSNWSKRNREHGERLISAKRPETRQKRFVKFMDMLVREENPGYGINKTKKI